MLIFRFAPLGYVGLVAFSWLTIFLLTRLVLLVSHLDEAGNGFFGLFFIGLIYDLGFLAYAILPLSAYVLLCPPVLWRSGWHRKLLQGIFVISVFLMLFICVAEWLFWDEFGVRFNFIAVDYLVYSDEVLNNLLESYPIGTLLAALALVALTLCWALRKPLLWILASPLPSGLQRLSALLVFAVLATGSAFLIDQDSPRSSGGNAYKNELASNGPYQFFAAFRNNELDFQQFFVTLPPEQVGLQIRAELAEPAATFLGSDPMDIRRKVEHPGTLRTPNIVLVMIESLSAKYMGSNGDSRNLTPHLDKLRKESLYFSNFYATGTRTVRGLEAITLSIPPTPGRSIVKRIGRESGYASLGQHLAAVGYDSVFVYGGRGYFDNMNAFFSGNGYRIVDQSTVPEVDISFKNAWGMADEDIYTQTLKLADSSFAASQPFFLQVLTTSNHRPYTFPEGKIDIQSGKGRAGAVKYTDYAIGEFLKAARNKPWFDDTLFVFVADHTAGSAGKEDLPVANYHIPLFIYAPKLVAPAEDAQLASQIDLAPTLLAMLNLSYESTFFGRDLHRPTSHPPRVFIGNYQHLGLYDGQDLAILSPRNGLRRHDDALGRSIELATDSNDPLIARAIAFYQAASYGLKQRLLDWKK